MSSTVLMKWLWPTMIFPSVGMSRRMACRSMGPLSHSLSGGGQWLFDFFSRRDPFEFDGAGHGSIGLGSFCNFACCRQRRHCFSNVGRDQGAEGGGGLQGLQFLEAAVESALDAGLMAGQAIELGLDLVVVEQVEVGGCAGAELGFHAADAAQVPGGGD